MPVEKLLNVTGPFRHRTA
nr:unnamed protein product [Callosobruchus analis]